MLNFTPGPSQLYFTVEDHVKRAFRDDIPSLSHRSKKFEILFAEATNGLRELLQLPENFHVAFTSSATEVWERSIQNLVEKKSFHLVNGAFSRRYQDVSIQLQMEATCAEVMPGKGFHHVSLPESELIGLTHNETSTGVSHSVEFIKSLRKQTKGLLVVDAVSSLPYPDFDYPSLDSVFFSVQKGFGLPAGLGVWIFNERCLDRAEQLRKSGQVIGSYHSLPTLASFAKKNQTPETPNVLGIYLLGRVIDDFLRRGITSIRKETEYKAAVLYQVLDRHPVIHPFVQDPADRSNTVITLTCGSRLSDLRKFLEDRGFSPGEGHGEFKNSQLRIANFPTHSKEQLEALADAIGQFQ